MPPAPFLSGKRIAERQAEPCLVAFAAAELAVRDPEVVKRITQYLEPAVIDTYLQMIASRCEAMLGVLRTPDALADSDDTLAEAAHTLAGSAGMLGFTRLADDGMRLERALRARLPGIPILADRMAKAIEATLDNISMLRAISA